MTKKHIAIALAGLLALGLLVYGFLPEPLAVDTAAAERGPLRVTVEEEGTTRIRERYVVSAPVTAYARRIELEPGDAVTRGDVLVQLEPPRASLLDPRSQAEATEAVDAARAALGRARSRAEAAEAAANLAEAKRARTARLVEAGARTREALEQAASEAEAAQADLEAARAEVEAARAELERARATARGREPEERLATRALRAPVSGTVLAVHRESGGHVTPGEALVDIADLTRLELRVEVLSQDAVDIGPGTRVFADDWTGRPGDARALEAVVQRLWPEAETAESALGVEEQRVTVVAGFSDPDAAREAGLGAGYRVLARFVVWEGEDVLRIPESALFRTDAGWAVFAVEDGRAELRIVSVGRRTGLRAQITEGLSEGDQVVAYPSADLENGSRVRTRE